MAKKRLVHLVPNDKDKTIEVIGGATALNDEEKAQLSIYIQAGYTPVFSKRQQTVRQAANTAKSVGKGKAYYIGAKATDTNPATNKPYGEDVKPAIEDEELREQFKTLLTGAGQGFKFAEKWYKNRDMAVAKGVEADVDTWEKATADQRIEAIAWLKTVDIKKGVPVPKKK